MRSARDEETEERQPYTHVSPAMRLYTHALESIFAMLELSDLSRVVCVSREWSAAVRSMKPIHASIERDTWSSSWHSVERVFRPLCAIKRIVASPLLRHVASIHIRATNAVMTPLNNKSLALLAQNAPYLTSLWCDLTLTPNKPLIMPGKLTSMELRLPGEYTDTQINSVLTTVAALPSLSHLALWIADFIHTTSVELRHLAACPSLTDLTLKGMHGTLPTLSNTQVEQIRSSLGHLRRFADGILMPSWALARFLRVPHTHCDGRRSPACGWMRKRRHCSSRCQHSPTFISTTPMTQRISISWHSCRISPRSTWTDTWKHHGLSHPRRYSPHSCLAPN